MLRIMKEEAKCTSGGKVFDCANGILQGTKAAYPLSYRIRADLYDCGDKQH
ncbi:hypothetical protein [Helicobacter mastomyrinus]|uniref:Uncharacterized protein n=1 Tax=Helicobacter mastomyrinus TaxID=287948 RepID=A0ABZ3F9E0_9HELI|nr:hypothetical protein [uncultured Helicobacter sp.]